MSKLVQRYTEGQRMNHWFIAVAFFLAALSGLALFHPALFFFSNLFGGGSWTRILHPFLGVAVFLGFLLMFFRVCGDNIGDSGKYNPSQKALFWMMTLCMLALVVTGFIFWRPWFTPYFSIPLMRVAVLVHAVAATLLIIGIIVHIYAAIWVKGALRGMTRGAVKESWARVHHPVWLKKVTGK